MWLYEPDESPKIKHHWNEPHAGFVEREGEVIGKCPNTMTVADATQLLNDGIPFFPKRWPHAYPKRIYVIKDGVVYRATPTNPGVSYHGFPEKPEELRNLPWSFRQSLVDRAKELCCEIEVRRWIRR